jgi:Family of unknown function (DUF6544)
MKRRITDLWNELSQPTPQGHFDLKQLEGLPDPARRYLAHAISPGATLASSVQLRMAGSIRLKPGGKWLPFEARQVLAPPRGFVWRAVVRAGLLRFSGADHYAAGSGGVDFWLWGIIPLVRASGPDISRSGRGRLAAESCWLPSSLLPSGWVRWRAVDAENAEALLDVDGEQIAVRFSVDVDGRLKAVRTQRWGDQTDDKTFALIPFGGHLEEDRRFGDYTIPTQVSVGWWYGTERYARHEFFRATLHSAEFR